MPKVARWQNLISSFPWIAPGWRAWGAILPSGNLGYGRVLRAAAAERLMRNLYSKRSKEGKRAIAIGKLGHHSESKAAGVGTGPKGGNSTRGVGHFLKMPFRDVSR